MNMRDTFRPDSGETFYKAERTPAIEAALRSSPFQTFLEFVQYPIWVTEPDAETDHGTRVRLVDLRFGTPYQPGFQTTAIVDRNNQVISSGFTFGQIRPR